MPAKAKTVMDRLLPTATPLIKVSDDGANFHPSRYDFSTKKYILISTCGFFEKTSNYESLISQFDLVYKNGYTEILCSEGELFRVGQLEERCREYLGYVEKAGEEYAEYQEISQNTRSLLDEKLFPPESFLEMANADWEVTGDSNCENKALRLLRQMAVIYNKRAYKEDIVL